MKRRSLTIAVLAVLLAIPIAVSAGPIQLTVAEIHPKDYPTTQGLFQFAELVKQRSGGEILIDVKYGGQLGKGEKKVTYRLRDWLFSRQRILRCVLTGYSSTHSRVHSIT